IKVRNVIIRITGQPVSYRSGVYEPIAVIDIIALVAEVERRFRYYSLYILKAQGLIYIEHTRYYPRNIRRRKRRAVTLSYFRFIVKRTHLPSRSRHKNAVVII